MAGVGGKDGWSWIFILEGAHMLPACADTPGILTLLCALPAWWIVFVDQFDLP